jgi:hypothetical protein
VSIHRPEPLGLTALCALVATLCALVAAPALAAERYVDVWGPAVGSALPLLDAEDQSGAPQDLASLTGREGLLLFLVRSADW